MAYVSVDVSMDEFSDDEILEEFQKRGLIPMGTGPLIEKIWMKRRQGQDITNELDQLIYLVLGKIV